METRTAPMIVAQRLMRATNAHDLDAMVTCFSSDYRSEFPNHPDRAFTGTEQVRRNWSSIFVGVPDIVATIQHSVIDGDTVWAEMEMRGTRPDGLPHLVRGPIIWGVAGDRIAWARLYLEPVDEHGAGSDAAVHAMVTGGVS